MILTTTKGERITVRKNSTYQFVMNTKTNRGFLRWLLIAILFFPALLLYFFVGDKAVCVRVDGRACVINEHQHNRLLEFLEG